MINIEALDIIFDFFPDETLAKLKNQGLYDLILSGKVLDGAQIYDYLDDETSALQDSDYGWLANGLEPFMEKGSILQIGCGRGNLLEKFANKKFFPLRGIDRSEVMLKKTKERLLPFSDNILLFCEKAENFDFSILQNIENVIINNFWGIISEENSVKLLQNLKKSISRNGVIIIGPVPEKQDILKLLAKKTLQNNLGFTFSYPFFNNFSQCGYTAKLENIFGVKYYILREI